MAPTILRLFDHFLFKIFEEAIKDFQEVLDWILIPPDDIFTCNQADICYIYHSTKIEDKIFTFYTETHVCQIKSLWRMCPYFLGRSQYL